MIKSCKDLKNKQLKFYQITVNVEIFYHLHLSESIKQLYLMFNLKLLYFCSDDSLSEQHSKSFRFLTIKDNEY